MGLKLCSTLDINKLIWQAGLIYTLAGSTIIVAKTTLSEELVASLKETFGIRNKQFALAA